MKIKHYLVIVILGSLGLGYAMEALLSSKYRYNQKMIEINNNYKLAIKDIDRLRSDINQYLISTDLILGSDQNYLLPSTFKKGKLIIQQTNKAKENLPTDNYKKGLEESRLLITTINKNISSSIEIKSENREQKLYALLLNNDTVANKLLVTIKKISSDIIAEQLAHEKTTNKAIKLSENIALFVHLIYAIIIFFIWHWANNRICKPISYLAEKSSDLEDSDNIELDHKGPKEISDLSQKIEASAKKLLYQARHDPLTQLYNRREFARKLTDVFGSIQTENQYMPALCFIDLDRFKTVNDSCGHAAGDELLVMVTKEICSNAGEDSIVARMGGDEFAVLMPNQSKEACLDAANKILNSIRDIKFECNSSIYRISASIGITYITDTRVNITEWLNAADSACFTAKNEGRDTIQIFSLDDTRLTSIRDETKTYNEVVEALNENRFVLHHQKILDLQNSDTQYHHYEILVRMLSKTGELIFPGKFLDIVERFDLAERLDTWVIENTIQWMEDHPDKMKDIHTFSINLSGKSLASQKMHNLLTSRVSSSPISSNKLCFEITETAAVNDMNAAKELIKSLRLLGCRFALDDFGTGQSSFGYLRNLDVDIIKIDGTFIRDMISNDFDQVMVKSMNELAKSVGMKTVAEYVENEEIATALREIGVDYAQGFHIHKPEPLDNKVVASAPPKMVSTRR